MRNCIIVILLAIWAAGCDQKAPSGSSGAGAKATDRVIAKVSIRIPAATAEMVDGLLTAGFSEKASAIGHVRSVTCISRDGLFEGYVDANSADPAEFLRQVEAAILSADLPANATKPEVTLVDRMPTEAATAVPEIDVSLNRDRLAAYGLTVEEVQAVVSKKLSDLAGRTTPADDLAQTVIQTSDGRAIQLRDVATFRQAMRPNCMVRKYPPQQAPATPVR